MKMVKLQNGDSNDLEKLPHHLIAEHILPRLPAKSLLRFKTVRKNWLSDISSPAFHKSHFEFSSSSPNFIHVHTNDDDFTMFLLSYDGSETIVKELLELPSGCVGDDSDVTLVDICNGIFCLHIDDGFHLWNPATDQYESLIHFSHTVDNFSDYNYMDSMLEAVGFGYVSSMDDYKVFAMYVTEEDRFGYFYLFSLNTGIWRSLSCLDGTYYPSSLRKETAVCIDEMLYWPLLGGETGAVIGVVGFDLVEEQMNKALDTPWLCHYNVVNHIFKMKGCLSLSCGKFQNHVDDVWILKEEGGPAIWLKLFSIDFEFVHVLGFTGNGKCLVHHSGQLKLIDPCQKDTDLSENGTDCDCDCDKLEPAIKYVESLISF